MDSDYLKLKCEGLHGIVRQEMRNSMSSQGRRVNPSKVDDVLHFLHRSDTRALLKLLFESKSPITLDQILHSIADTAEAPLVVSCLIEGENLGIVNKRSYYDQQTGKSKEALKLTSYGEKVFVKCQKLCQAIEAKYES